MTQRTMKSTVRFGCTPGFLFFSLRCICIKEQLEIQENNKSYSWRSISFVVRWFYVDVLWALLFSLSLFWSMGEILGWFGLEQAKQGQPSQELFFPHPIDRSIFCPIDGDGWIVGLWSQLPSVERCGAKEENKNLASEHIWFMVAQRFDCLVQRYVGTDTQKTSWFFFVCSGRHLSRVE